MTYKDHCNNDMICTCNTCIIIYGHFNAIINLKETWIVCLICIKYFLYLIPEKLFGMLGMLECDEIGTLF